VRRHATALLLLPLLAAGCTDSEVAFPCPGNRVASFTFKEAPLLASGCDSGAPAAGIGAVYPGNVTFSGTISFAASGNVAAFCGIGPNAEPLVGTQVADQVEVALDTRGALLSACNARCAVTVHQSLSGRLQRDPGGLPTGFIGTFSDRATLDSTIAGGNCLPCVPPCQATYQLTGQLNGTR
jgi:hypothetical protein